MMLFLYHRRVTDAPMSQRTTLRLSSGLVTNISIFAWLWTSLENVAMYVIDDASQNEDARWCRCAWRRLLIKTVHESDPLITAFQASLQFGLDLCLALLGYAFHLVVNGEVG